MARYARFDHTAPSPAPVLGWYDTDLINYVNLPPAADLVAVPDEIWEASRGALDSYLVAGDGTLIKRG